MSITTAVEGFGLKRVLRDCSRYRAMPKRQSTMLKFFKKLTEHVPDSLHSFENARQVGLCLLPTAPHLRYNTSKVLGM